MSWDDIDFALIVPGMITKGPAQASFADYLNQFSRALDERLNMLIETPDGSYPVLPNIEFEEGEIRTGTDADFWVKLKSMITGYYSLWSAYDWHSVELMTDPVNHADYLLEDSDLIAVITQETFDIIKDVNNSFVLEYFSAAVLNALYEIYKLTQYTRVRSSTIRNEGEDVSWGSSSINFLENKGVAGGDSDPTDDHLSFGAANGQAYGLYGTDYAAAESNRGSRVVEITTGARRNVNGAGDDEWSMGYSQAANGLSLHSRYRDLNDVLLDMEINVYVAVVRNAKFVQQDFGVAVPYGVYDSNFPQVKFNDPSVDANATSLFLDTNHQQPFGTVNTWAGNGGTYNNPALLKQVSVSNANTPEGEQYLDTQFFDVALNNRIATNINNPGLEFFIG